MSINVMWNRSGVLDALSAFVGGYGKQNQQNQAQQAQMDYTADVANQQEIGRGISGLIGPALNLGTAYLGANAAGLPADEAKAAAIASVMPRSVASSIMGRQEMGRDLEYNNARYEQDFQRTFGFPSTEAPSVGEAHYARLDPAMQQQVLSSYDMTPETFASMPQPEKSRTYGRMARDFVTSQQARQQAQVKMQVVEQARAADEAQTMRTFGDLEIAEGLTNGKIEITNPVLADKWSRVNSSLEGITDDPSIAGDPRLVSAFQQAGNGVRMNLVKQFRNAGALRPKLSAQDMAERAKVVVNGRVLLPHGKGMDKILDLGDERKSVEYPQGQGVGETWENPRFPGALLSRKPTGEVYKVIDTAGKQVGPQDFFELREKIRESLTTEPDELGNVIEPNADQIDDEFDRTMDRYMRRFGKQNDQQREPPAPPTSQPAGTPAPKGSWLDRLMGHKVAPQAGAPSPGAPGQTATPGATPAAPGGKRRNVIPKIRDYLDYDEEKGVLGLYNAKTKSWRYIKSDDSVNVDAVLELDSAVRDSLRRPVKDPKTGKTDWVEPSDDAVRAALEKRIDEAMKTVDKYRKGKPKAKDGDAPPAPPAASTQPAEKGEVSGRPPAAGKPLITGERATEISREMAKIAKQYPGAKGAPEHVKRRYYNLKKELEALTRG